MGIRRVINSWPFALVLGSVFLVDAMVDRADLWGSGSAAVICYVVALRAYARR
jgi:hypothetical protein